MAGGQGVHEKKIRDLLESALLEVSNHELDHILHSIEVTWNIFFQPLKKE